MSFVIGSKVANKMKVCKGVENQNQSSLFLSVYLFCFRVNLILGKERRALVCISKHFMIREEK